MSPEPAWSIDDVTVELFIDHTGIEAYKLTTPTGISSFVSSAHLVEERKIQLHRAYGMIAPLQSGYDPKAIASDMHNSYMDGFLRDFRVNEGLVNVLNLLRATVLQAENPLEHLDQLLQCLAEQTPEQARQTKA